MAKTGRPAATLDEWLDWKQRLESQKASGLSAAVYCLQEGVAGARDGNARAARTVPHGRWQDACRHRPPRGGRGACRSYVELQPALRFHVARLRPNR